MKVAESTLNTTPSLPFEMEQAKAKTDVKNPNLSSRTEDDFGASIIDISESERSEPKEVKSDQYFQDIKDNLKKLNDFIPVQSTSLVFEFDELGDPPVVKVLDKDSQEVIREIPPKEFREMAQALQEVADKLSNSKGVLFNDTV